MILCSMSPISNNVRQIKNASLLLRPKDNNHDYGLMMDVVCTVADDICRNIHSRQKFVKTAKDILQDESIFKNIDTVFLNEKNEKMNLDLLLLDNEPCDTRLKIRLTEDEKLNLEMLSRSTGTSMKNVILAKAMSGNLYKASFSQMNNTQPLREYGALINGIAKFLNETVKSQKKLETLDIVSIITDLNSFDEFIREDTDVFLNSEKNISRILNVRMKDEGIYWTSSFRRKVKENLYGRKQGTSD